MSSSQEDGDAWFYADQETRRRERERHTEARRAEMRAEAAVRGVAAFVAWVQGSAA